MNRIPLIGWLISFVLTVSLSVPFWFVWTFLGIGETYFGEWLPTALQGPGFWSCVGIFICLGILSDVIFPRLHSLNNDD